MLSVKSVLVQFTARSN